MSGIKVTSPCTQAPCLCRWYIADRTLPGTGVAKERMIIMRGASWRTNGPDNFRIWRELARVWPQAFEADSVTPKGCLLAHAGKP